MGKALSDLSLRGRKAFTELSVNLRKIGLTSSDVFFKIFDSQIQPILMYASEVWGLKRYDSIEKVHLTACKSFLNVGPQTPNAIVYGECGRYPIFINSASRSIKYCLKLLSMHEDRLPRKAYNMLLHMDNNGHKTWASEIRYLLFSYGFGFVWLSQTVGNSVDFLSVFKRRAIDIFIKTGDQCLNLLQDIHFTESSKLCLHLRNTLTILLILKYEKHLLSSEQDCYS